MKINVVLVSVVNSITLEVEPSDTVKSVKEKIAEIQGIPVDEQRYIFNQKELKDDRAILGFIGIQDGSIIFEFTVVGDT